MRSGPRSSSADGFGTIVRVKSHLLTTTTYFIHQNNDSGLFDCLMFRWLMHVVEHLQHRSHQKSLVAL